MADPPRHSDTGDRMSEEADHGSTIGTPRWVKVSAVVLLLLVVLVVVMLVIGGNHGPGRHASSADAVEQG
jgi:hypothetical protein